VSNRYQEYDPNFSEKQSETPMISPGLGSIDKVPIYMIVGSEDTHCSLDHAQRIAREIGPAVKTLDSA
jgi:predicted esterase